MEVDKKKKITIKKTSSDSSNKVIKIKRKKEEALLEKDNQENIQEKENKESKQQNMELPKEELSQNIEKEKKNISSSAQEEQNKDINDSNRSSHKNNTNESHISKENTSKKAFAKKNVNDKFSDKFQKDFKEKDRKNDNLSSILMEPENKKQSKVDWKKKKNKKDEFIKEEEKEFELQRKNKTPISQSSVPSEIEISETILVKDLAKKMNIKVGDLISKLLSMGYMATINDALDVETAEIIANEFGCKIIVKSIYEELKELEDAEEEVGEAQPRPPVVTIMGHVDHGKTTLLDTIRASNIAAKEAGGITQHIGAYQIETPKGKITFIDTPGHAAFTQMRERGAMATDIVVLVVAADDGVMTQTIEALNHAKAAKVPIIVAINKIDKPDANPDRVKQQLSEHGLIPEDWGGHTQFIPVSALKNIGIKELLEAILLEAEMRELKAHPTKRAEGIIIETRVDKGKGVVATVIIKEGTLRKGDFFVAGCESGKIRAMFDHMGNPINEAPPSTPVEIIGFWEVPAAGDFLKVYKDEKKANEIAEKKREIKRIEQAKKVSKKVSLDDLYQQMQSGTKQDFNIIIKADVQGTAEAIKGLIEKFAQKVQEVNLKVIHYGVGEITENDIDLASASLAIIIGFNVRPNNKSAQLAKEKGIEIRKYSIIYEIVDDIKTAIEGMLKPEEKEVILGQIEVRQVIKVPKIGVVAGCYVVEGIVKRNAKIRVIRDGIVIHDGKIATLKRFKDDVKEVAKGFECGISLENFSDFKEKDILEAYEIQQIAKKLAVSTSEK